MKPPIVDYVKPETVEEVLDLLALHGDLAKVLAGGQSLVPLLNMRFAFPTLLVDINGLETLSGIRASDDMAILGAITRQSDAENSDLVRTSVPLLSSALHHVGHYVTRNRGTVGGSIVHADPRAELPVVMSALAGQAVVASNSGRRIIDAADLFVTYYTNSMEDDELLLETRWPLAKQGEGFAFEEFALRHGDFAVVMVACRLRIDGGVVGEASIAVGSVADKPVLLLDVANSIVGQPVTEEAAIQAGHVASDLVDPSADLHASAEYRRHLVGLLTKRAILSAWDSAS